MRLRTQASGVSGAFQNGDISSKNLTEAPGGEVAHPTAEEIDKDTLIVALAAFVHSAAREFAGTTVGV